MLPPLHLTKTLSETGAHQARVSGVQSAVGLPAKKTNGRAPAAMNGILSTREESAHPAFISGLKRNAYLVADGHRIRYGMRRFETLNLRYSNQAENDHSRDLHERWQASPLGCAQQSG